MRGRSLVVNVASACRAGVSLVEVVTVIGIIGLLLGIIIPAVQASRASSTRWQCANNERQLILAMTNYHDSYGVFPPCTAWPTSGGCPPETAITRLFPFLELPNICTLVNSKVQRQAWLECPADDDIGIVVTPLSYSVNMSPGVGSGTLAKGPFEDTGVVSARDVSDGLSQTAALSENIGVRANGSASIAAKDPIRYGWAVVLQQVADSTVANPSSAESLADRSRQTDLSVLDCNQGPREFQSVPFPMAGQWGAGVFAFGTWGYSHWYPPNSPSCIGLGAGMSDTQIFLINNHRSASRHSGGVNAGFLDGHVKFVSDRIDQSIWRAAGTRNGNEPTEGIP